MNDKKRENVVHCWEKTGILSIWNVDERARLAPRAFSEVARLFPGNDNDKNDTSGSVNDVDDQELFDDLSSKFATAVDKETGEVTRKETDEEAAIEDELIAAVVANAQSSSGGPTTEERETDSICILLKLIVLLIARKIAGGPGEAMMGPTIGGVMERGGGCPLPLPWQGPWSGCHCICPHSST